MRLDSEWWPLYRDHFRHAHSLAYILVLLGLGFAWARVHRDRRCDRANRGLAVSWGLLSAGLACCWLGAHLPQPWVSTLLAMLLYGVLVLFLGFIVINWRVVPLTEAGIMALFYLLSVRYGRAMVDSALVSAPFLLAAASIRLKAERRGVLLGAALLGALAGYAILSPSWPISVDSTGQKTRPGEIARLPTCAFDVIARHRLSGRAFLSIGGWPEVTFHAAPALLGNLAWDYVAGEGQYRDYIDAHGGISAAQQYLTRHQIDLVIVTHAQNMPRLVEDLLQPGMWAAVHVDDAWSVLVPRRPGHERLITREGYRFLRPWGHVAALVTRANAAQVLDEADRALRHCPAHATFVHAYRATAYSCLGRHEDAQAAARLIPQPLVLW
jgi:hypothetical protein